MPKIDAALLSELPVPFWLFVQPGDSDWRHPSFEWTELLAPIDKDLTCCSYRGLAAERLPSVLRNGVDVEPTDSVIYVEDFTKAWEYGGWPKLILAFHPGHLMPTHREVRVDTPEAELRKLRRIYPTVLKSKDGTRLWFSRMKKDDPRLASQYEVAYARCIPKDPFDALRAVLLFKSAEHDTSDSLGQAG